MKIFLDFDDTLFDTRNFKQGLFSVFHEYGIENKVLEDSYKYISQDRVHGGFIYSPYIHVKTIQERNNCDMSFSQELFKKIDSFLVQGLAQYLFEDSLSFVQSFRREDVFILSFGDKDFQLKKVQGSQLGIADDNIFITQKRKSDVLTQNKTLVFDNPTFFIDDREKFIREVKEKCPNVQTILIQRPEGRYNDEKSVYCDYKVKNLIEAKEIIIHNS